MGKSKAQFSQKSLKIEHDFVITNGNELLMQQILELIKANDFVSLYEICDYFTIGYRRAGNLAMKLVAQGEIIKEVIKIKRKGSAKISEHIIFRVKPK